MPKVYDWNGTAATDIKKIYDWNGSAATQIKKGYDNNGSASSPIYTSDIIFAGANRDYASGWTTMWELSTPYQGTLTLNGNTIVQTTGNVVYTQHGGAGNARTSVAIDLTSFSRLYFTVSYYVNATKGVVGFSRDAKPAGTTDGYQLFALDRSSTYTGTGTFSVNVSDLSGNYYLFLELLAYIDNANRSATANFSSMYLI